MSHFVERPHAHSSPAPSSPRRWLQAHRWDDLVRTLAAFRHIPPGHLESPDAVRTRLLWEQESSRELSLTDVLRLCRRCHAARPFGDYDCEMFAGVARDIVKPMLAQISATLAAAIVVIIGDYVRGAGEETEMRQAVNLLLEKSA